MPIQPSYRQNSKQQQQQQTFIHTGSNLEKRQWWGAITDTRGAGRYTTHKLDGSLELPLEGRGRDVESWCNGKGDQAALEEGARRPRGRHTFCLLTTLTRIQPDLEERVVRSCFLFRGKGWGKLGRSCRPIPNSYQWRFSWPWSCSWSRA